jgi:hypothetical protein
MPAPAVSGRTKCPHLFSEIISSAATRLDLEIRCWGLELVKSDFRSLPLALAGFGGGQVTGNPCGKSDWRGQTSLGKKTEYPRLCPESRWTASPKQINDDPGRACQSGNKVRMPMRQMRWQPRYPQRAPLIPPWPCPDHGEARAIL